MSLDFFETLAERKVQEAMEEGVFENLPGKGEPLRFESPTGVPYAEMIANKIMQNAGVLPEWMQAQKELEEEISAFSAQRAKLIAENEKRQAKIIYLPADHIIVAKHRAWHKSSREGFHRKLKRINGLILKLNLTAPSTVSLPGLYKIEEEMVAFDADFPAVSEDRLAPSGSSAP